jgi:hypothetical protein
MRYTEKEYNYEYDNMKDWLQNSAALIIVAPLRLFNEVSTKFIYLDRRLINKILNLAFVIDAVCTGLYAGVNYWLGSFDFLVGKVPLILQVVSLIIIAVFNLWYKMYDFVIYKQLEYLLPALSNGINEHSENDNIEDTKSMTDFDGEVKKQDYADFESSILTELKDLEIPDITPADSKVDISTLTSALADDNHINVEDVYLDEPNKETVAKSNNTTANIIELDDINDELMSLLNEDLLDDESVIEYQNKSEYEIKNLDLGVDNTNLETEMDDSTDPSKYVSEDGLFKFLNEIGAESMGDFDTFDTFTVPDNFDLVS